MFYALVLSLKPGGGLYNWLNVGHRRKERERGTRKTKAVTSVMFNKG